MSLSSYSMNAWQSQIAAYRVGIIIVAVLVMGAGITFFARNNIGEPPMPTVVVPTSVSDSVTKPPRSLSLSQNDDPEILMAEATEVSDVDDDLDREIDQLEREFDNEAR